MKISLKQLKMEYLCLESTVEYVETFKVRNDPDNIIDALLKLSNIMLGKINKIQKTMSKRNLTKNDFKDLVNSTMKQHNQALGYLCRAKEHSTIKKLFFDNYNQNALVMRGAGDFEEAYNNWYKIKVDKNKMIRNYKPKEQKTDKEKKSGRKTKVNKAENLMYNLGEFINLLRNK